MYVAESESQPLGFYALMIHENRLSSIHMWVAPEYIGTAVGKELFIHAMQNAAREKISEVGISSDPNAEGFYPKDGCALIDEAVSEIDDQARALACLNC